jgi:hypothetical protein
VCKQHLDLLPLSPRRSPPGDAADGSHPIHDGRPLQAAVTSDAAGVLTPITVLTSSAP